MAKHILLGIKGENLAVEYLEKLGYEICDRNWTFKKSEIDIVAYKDQKLVFVEVKTRSNNAFGEPEDFVGQAKQRVLDRAAGAYIHLINYGGEIRFDVIAILFNSAGAYTLRHIEDAFWPQAF